jgi:uncharacterized membrane protein YedE/YeeE
MGRRGTANALVRGFSLAVLAVVQRQASKIPDVECLKESTRRGTLVDDLCSIGGKECAMANPFTAKSWSPYAAGLGIGLLSWFAFATANKHLAITLQYEHIAAMIQMALAPEAAGGNRYYAVRAEAGLQPKVGWYLMLLVGVFLGALLSARLSGDRSRVAVPPLWRWRFGISKAKRFAAAFAGGAVMVFGARVAGGCTSGHGISGTLQLAVQSWLFIGLAFAAAIATAFLIFGREARNHV